MAKAIAGITETKSKLLAPIHTYEVDIGKGKPLLIEANRVDQIGETITFIIEYSDHTLHVAGFSKWNSYQIYKPKEVEERTKSLDPKPKPQPQFQFPI